MEESKTNIELIIAVFIVIAVIIGILYFSGMVFNDDESFLRKAEAIIDDVWPVTSYNADGDEATDYRLELADYRLSPKCQEIRDDIDFALDQIEFIDSMNDYSYVSYDLLSSSADMANLDLESARDAIKEMQ